MQAPSAWNTTPKPLTKCGYATQYGDADQTGRDPRLRQHPADPESAPAGTPARALVRRQFTRPVKGKQRSPTSSRPCSTICCIRSRPAARDHNTIIRQRDVPPARIGPEREAQQAARGSRSICRNAKRDQSRCLCQRDLGRGVLWRPDPGRRRAQHLWRSPDRRRARSAFPHAATARSTRFPVKASTTPMPAGPPTRARPLARRHGRSTAAWGHAHGLRRSATRISNRRRRRLRGNPRRSSAKTPGAEPRAGATPPRNGQQNQNAWGNSSTQQQQPMSFGISPWDNPWGMR